MSHTAVRFSAIVAADDRGIIGHGNDLPWDIPDDRKRFRRLTDGHVVVVGRLTHESIVGRLGRPLPNRTTVVVSRQPQPDEAHNCQEYLEQTLELVRPKFVCALGGTAAKYLLGTEMGITRLRGRFYDYRGTPVMCTFHPSYLLRSPEKKKDVWEDMKTLLRRMGKPVPGKG